MDAVIQLPPNLFFGVGIATCIIVLKKSKKDNAILFINASDEFVKAGNKNKLTEANQQKILDAFTARRDADYFAKLIPAADLADKQLQPLRLRVRRTGEHERKSRHHGAQRRDRGYRRPPSEAPRAD